MAHTLDRAITQDPEKADYGLLAVGLSLRAGRLQKGLEHFKSGLESQPPRFLKSQPLLWTARTAGTLGKTVRASRAKADLQNREHPLIGRYQEQARKPYSKS